jgi:hypothetical protein
MTVSNLTDGLGLIESDFKVFETLIQKRIDSPIKEKL